jgi:hypothetical protein
LSRKSNKNGFTRTTFDRIGRVRGGQNLPTLVVGGIGHKLDGPIYKMTRGIYAVALKGKRTFVLCGASGAVLW